MDNKIEFIELTKIKIEKFNVRKHDIDKGIAKLAENIKALGLIEPITVYKKSDDGKYVILVGQRRFWAHQFLNYNYPNEKFGKEEQLPNVIKCRIIPEPETDEVENG